MLTCSNCGEKIKDNARACPKCGQDIQNVIIYQTMDDLLYNARAYEDITINKLEEIYRELNQWLKELAPGDNKHSFYTNRISEIDNNIQQKRTKKLAMEKKMTDKLEAIYAMGYFLDPYLDEDLKKVLKDGGGWAAKIPSGDGFILIHVKDAELDMYRTILKAMRPKETIQYRFKDERIEVDGSQIGFVCKVRFTNMSSAPFADEWWRNSDGHIYNSKFRFNTHKDGRYWNAGYPYGSGVMDKFKGLELFDNTLTLAPGQTKERVFMFLPSPVPNEPTFFSDLAWGEYIAPFKLPDGLASSQGPLSGVVNKVGFPFFTLTPPLNDKRAKVLIEVQNKLFVRQGDRDKGIYFALPTGFRFGTPKPNRRYNYEFLEFQLYALTVIPYTKHPDVILKKRVWMTATEPGVMFNVPENQNWNQTSPEIIGDPWQLIVNNPDPATGGKEPDKVPPLVLHEPREGEETMVIREEDMADPVLTYAQWLLTHSDLGYRKFAAIRLGELGDRRAIDVLIQVKDIKDHEINMAVHSSFKRLTNMSIASWLKDEENKRAERERFTEIALKHARVTNVTIRDSVVQRSTISIKDGGVTSVDIKDTVMVRSDIDGADKPGKENTTAIQPSPGANSTIRGDGPTEDDMKRYEAALIQALVDGQIKPQEERFLKQLRERFGITDDEHDMLLAMLKPKNK